MKKTLLPKPPVALACGLLEDGNRALFLLRKDALGREALELPCALVFAGENPVFLLSAEFKRQTGIDGQVHAIIMEGRQNVGSRRERIFVPVLVFKVTSKSASAKQASEFSGYEWLERRELAGRRLGRNLEWLRFKNRA